MTVGAVGAMVEVEPNDSLDDFGSRDNVGVAMGAVAGYEGRVSAAAMMAAADPGIDAPPPVPLPTIGRAGVS